jgi:hypothetical protein
MWAFSPLSWCISFGPMVPSSELVQSEAEAIMESDVVPSS